MNKFNLRISIIFLVSMMYVVFNSLSFSQQIQGKITSLSGKPLSNVKVKNEFQTVFSNAMGEFSLFTSKETSIVRFSLEGYIPFVDTVTLHAKNLVLNIQLEEQILNVGEVKVVAKSKKQLGKEIMKQVIAKNEVFRNTLLPFSTEIYCITELDKEVLDSTKTESTLVRENQLEWKSTSYFKPLNKIKDYYEGYLDYSDQGKIELHGDPSITSNANPFFEESLIPNLALKSNPYVFVKGLKEAYFPLYLDRLEFPSIASKPIISPLASNAFLNYAFYLEDTDNAYPDSTVYEIRVSPLFNSEALFFGTIYVLKDAWQVVDYDLFVNKDALSYFSSMEVKASFKRIGDYYYPNRQTFNYFLYDGGTFKVAKTEAYFKNYTFSLKDTVSFLETSTYASNAEDRDTIYWNSVRPNTLSSSALKFIHTQDSLKTFHQSREYLNKEDSIYNAIKFWDVVINGIGFRNTFKKRELWISPLIAQLMPFGVGGYRHRLAVNYKKTFTNWKSIAIEPTIDYGFLNKDLKGELALGYTYNPKRFSTITVMGGDIYDYVNSYQSIVGTLGPANRVRNQKFSISHRFELVNGFFVKTEFMHSNRFSIGSLKYPEWVNAFGVFAKPQNFEGYKISQFTLDLEYVPKQKFILKEQRKIVLGSTWPKFGMKVNIGIPNLFGGQSNFGFAEGRVSNQGKFRSLGDYSYRLSVGKFLYTTDLRLIEHKYFRTSDLTFFSNPTNSLQLLDTNMNTQNSYIQFNIIHHFNGFFLSKIWGINKLKLEESVGGGFLALPNTSFKQLELFAGIERKVRIRKQLVKFGLYIVQANSSIGHQTRLKFGINFYDSFHAKWMY